MTTPHSTAPHSKNPTNRWGDQMPGILRLCHTQDGAKLPAIWSTIAPIYKDRSHTAMESVCRAAADRIPFRAPLITHPVTVMLLALDLYTEEPDGVGDSMNIFLFPELSPSIGSEATLLNRQWDTVLGDNTFTYFANTGTLIGIQKVIPIR